MCLGVMYVCRCGVCMFVGVMYVCRCDVYMCLGVMCVGVVCKYHNMRTESES